MHKYASWNVFDQTVASPTTTATENEGKWWQNSRYDSSVHPPSMQTARALIGLKIVTAGREGGEHHEHRLINRGVWHEASTADDALVAMKHSFQRMVLHHFIWLPC